MKRNTLVILAALLLGTGLAACTAEAPAPPAAVNVLAEVPLVEGDNLNEVTDGGVRSAIIAVADAEAQEAALQLLIDDGFEIVGESENGGRRNVVLDAESVTASVVLENKDGVFRVLYNISEKS